MCLPFASSLADYGADCVRLGEYDSAIDSLWGALGIVESLDGADSKVKTKIVSFLVEAYVANERYLEAVEFMSLNENLNSAECGFASRARDLLQQAQAAMESKGN